MAKEPSTSIPSRYLRSDIEKAVVPDADRVLQIPVIDMQKLVTGGPNNSEIEKLDFSCKEWGFFQLANHGVDSTLLENLKAEVAKFFKLPMEKKKWWQRPGNMRDSDKLLLCLKIKSLIGVTSQVAMCRPYPWPEIVATVGEIGKMCSGEMVEKALRMANESHRLFVAKECHLERMARLSPGRRRSVKATKPRKRLGPIEGINAVKQGSRRGKAVDVEAAEPGRKHDETAGVKAVEHKKGLDAIVRDKAVKLRVQSEQVCSQYARMEIWSKLRRLSHKGTLKEYVSRFRKLMLKVSSLTEENGFFTFMFGLKPWAKRLLERREVKELSKALKTAESIKEFGVKKNKTSKTKPKAEGSGKRIHDEGKSKDDEYCSSSGRESPLNDEPDGESGEVVCSLGTSSSVKDANPRGVESFKVMDEPRIELFREDDEPRIEEALRVVSIRFISAKASRIQVQEELFVSKEFVEHVRVENMASETILREGSKQGHAENVQVRNNPSKTSRQESKEAKTLRDKATTEKLPNNKWFYKAENYSLLVYFPTSLSTAMQEKIAEALHMKIEEMKEFFGEGSSDDDGLEIRKYGKWVRVHPHPDAFIINVGELLEIISNERYRSIEHPGTVHSEKEQLSFATFFGLGYDGELGHASSLVSDQTPAKFTKVKVQEFYKGLFSRRLQGKAYIDTFKIQQD
ncbi:Protein SRG1 [Hibiscus syriacus]|uniref:Protein SRG1 n=1 Tax=Hibiscus syriacus TaxID=106335 RepID=A0A6A3AGY7_HIBSY|nr:Protein SRG1 [Hibiscus syriacus]